MTRLQNIPTYLIAGPLGAGKTTLLRRLFEQRPADERWAVLINEFGVVGIDAALLGRNEGIQIAEIPGGCLCCVNGLPFQVGLGRLLRKARPDRLFIEASGLGHPAELLKQLQVPPWQGVLQIENFLMVLDAAALQAGRPLAPSQRDALPLADILILNKMDELASGQTAAIIANLPEKPVICCEQGNITWPLGKVRANPLVSDGQLVELPAAPPLPGRLWRSVNDWECHAHSLEGWHSIGWLMHPARCFDRDQVDRWLANIRFSRAKGVLHAQDGWYRLNRLAAGERDWEPTEPGSANRLELLLDQPCDLEALDQGLRAASRAD